MNERVPLEAAQEFARALLDEAEIRQRKVKHSWATGAAAQELLVTYPAAGGYAALKAGRTEIDLVASQVVEPDGTKVTLQIPNDLRGNIRSGFVIVDQDCLISVNPSLGSVVQPGSSAFTFQGLSARSIHIVLKNNYTARLFAVFSAKELSPMLPGLTLDFQRRFSGASSVATTSAFLAVKMMVDVDPALALDWTTNRVLCEGYQRKVFLIYNSDATDLARVRLVGRARDVDGAQEFVDTESLSNSAVGYEGIAVSTAKVLETTAPWATLECQVRNEPDTGGAGQATLFVYYAGYKTT